MVCKDNYITNLGAQWSSAWLETEGTQVWASPVSLRCGSWPRHIYPSLVLIQPRKTCHCLTERLLMGRTESNQTKQNKITNLGGILDQFWVYQMLQYFWTDPPFRFFNWFAYHYNQTYKLSQCMRFPTMWYVRPAKPKAQINLRTEPLLVVWVFHDCKATDWTPFRVSKLKRRLQRLVQVYTCQNVKLLEISCRGSIVLIGHTTEA